jgi:hypothetical protein
MILAGYPMNAFRVSHEFLVWKNTMTTGYTREKKRRGSFSYSVEKKEL